MIPAKTSQRYFEQTKLIVVQGADRISHALVGEIGNYLRPGDLLVVNRSGTLPASFRGKVIGSEEPIELRLAAFRGENARDLGKWAAVTFGSGDWRQPTEKRGPSPTLREGDCVHIGADLTARIIRIDPQFSRLIELEFDSLELVRSLYAHGKPIQYSYLSEELQVWDQQTLFAGPGLSVEPPSAAFPFDWKLLLALKKQGVAIVTLVHGAGLSSTGDPILDARFPLAEYFEIPAKTLKAVARTRRAGGRVIALGTTVARALESAFLTNSPLVSGYTELKLGPDRPLRVVNALITGMHETGTSHAELMKAFCTIEALQQTDREVNRLTYRSHEFGDLALLACPIAKTSHRAVIDHK